MAGCASDMMMSPDGPPDDPPMMDVGPQTASGVFTLLPPGEARGLEVTGTASIEIGFRETRVVVEIEGLTPGETYPAHLHNAPCAMAGGGHYKIDRAVDDVIEENEVWPTVTVGDDGRGTGEAMVAHNARADAQSVVIHDPLNGDKLLCADLALRGAEGSFEPLAAQPASGIELAGRAQMVVGEDWTAVFVRVTREGIMGMLPAHLHAESCATEGGGHYKIDPSVEDTIAANEIWPAVRLISGDYRYGYAIVPHVVREDARSVVIHDPDSGDKIYCADLGSTMMMEPAAP